MASTDFHLGCGYPSEPGKWLNAKITALALVLICVSAFSCSTAFAMQEKRVALIIGNSAYASVPMLPNPVSDAGLVADTLRSSSFDKVTLVKDVSREKLLEALRSFSADAEGSDWAVIYFAGHGIEMNGVNYIIPVDAKLAADRDLQFEAISMAQVLASLEGAKKLRLLVLDACRDNPFAAQMTRTLATRSIGRGLARIEPDGGTLIAYAAKHGQVAQDGADGHSPFVTSLVKHVNEPGLEISRLFRRVRSDVLSVTHNRQEPFVYGSLSDDDFYFRPPAQGQAPAAVPAIATPTPAETPAKPAPQPVAVEKPSPAAGNSNGSQGGSAVRERVHTAPGAAPRRRVADIEPPTIPAAKPKSLPAPPVRLKRTPKVQPAPSASSRPIRRAEVSQPRQVRSKPSVRQSGGGGGLGCFRQNGEMVCY